MIAFFGLFFEMNILIKLLFAWERYAVNSLQIIILSIAEPVSRRILHDFESFYHLGAWNVGTRA
jgi:hypothetical protein